MKAIIYTKQDWDTNIWPRIKADYGQAVIISWVCRERLGFTVRTHRAPVSDDGHNWEHQYQIHLDFYDEQMRTLFILKYT